VADDRMEVLDRVDPAADFRNTLRHLAESTEEWAGIPFTMEGGPNLIVEPSYPYAKVFAKPDTDEAVDNDGWTFRSQFYSHNRRSQIVIMEKDGKIEWGPVPHVHNLDQQLATMMASGAWGIEQEHHALQLLGKMIPHHQFKSYLLAGMFVERSKRSDVLYLFRKLRPTVAITNSAGYAQLPGAGRRQGQYGERLRILTAMCMHPIGYYEESWAGAMCPTDDVVAHLTMMRADEHMFWRRCNQHPAWASQAGL